MVAQSAGRPLGELHAPPPNGAGGGVMPGEAVAIGDGVRADHGGERGVDVPQRDARDIAPRAKDRVERRIREPRQHPGVAGAALLQGRLLLVEPKAFRHDRLLMETGVRDHVAHRVADDRAHLVMGLATRGARHPEGGDRITEPVHVGYREVIRVQIHADYAEVLHAPPRSAGHRHCGEHAPSLAVPHKPPGKSFPVGLVGGQVASERGDHRLVPVLEAQPGEHHVLPAARARVRQAQPQRDRAGRIDRGDTALAAGRLVLRPEHEKLVRTCRTPPTTPSVVRGVAICRECELPAEQLAGAKAQAHGPHARVGPHRIESVLEGPKTPLFLVIRAGALGHRRQDLLRPCDPALEGLDEGRPACVNRPNLPAYTRREGVELAGGETEAHEELALRRGERPAGT